MTAAERRDRYSELRRRTIELARLGDPVPAVSSELAVLLVDLLGELGGCVEELAELEARA